MEDRIACMIDREEGSHATNGVVPHASFGGQKHSPSEAGL